MLRAISILGFCACAGDAPSTTLDPEAAESVATAIATTLQPAGDRSGELAVIRDVAALVRGELPTGHETRGDGEVHAAQLGFSYDYAVRCRDTANRPLGACDGRTTNAD